MGNTNHKETPQRAEAQVVCPDDLCGGTGPGVSPVIELNQRLQGEASNRVGRNDRLGCGREEMDAREWRGGQKVGGNQEPSGPE